MNLILAAVCICINLTSVLAAGAGRAIPIETENYVERLFRSENNRIEYDSSNFLVDLSGNYANCNFVGIRELSSAGIDTPKGDSIGVIQDSTFSSGTDTGSVDSDVRSLFDSWVKSFGRSGAYFRAQIQNADRFGCSVRPGCSGKVVVACLFSPRYDPPQKDEPENNQGGQKALAFNYNEYKKAEEATGKKWDADHFLENLSGYETQCSMIGRTSWNFRKAIDVAGDHGKSVTGIFGYTENLSGTFDAIRDILTNIRNNVQNDLKLVDFLKAVSDEDVKKEVGCSVIPDCLDSNGVDIYVVLSCLVEV